jgi:hypothetical protein
MKEPLGEGDGLEKMKALGSGEKPLESSETLKDGRA